MHIQTAKETYNQIESFIMSVLSLWGKSKKEKKTSNVRNIPLRNSSTLWLYESTVTHRSRLVTEYNVLSSSWDTYFTACLPDMPGYMELGLQLGNGIRAHSSNSETWFCRTSAWSCSMAQIEISHMWHAWNTHQVTAVAGSLLTVAANQGLDRHHQPAQPTDAFFLTNV